MFKTCTTVTQATEMKASGAEREERRDKNKLRKWELTPSLPSSLRELESIAVTHGAEEDHRQHHQSQLHSPCCLSGHTGSPPATRWSRYVERFLYTTGEDLCGVEGWSFFFPVVLLTPPASSLPTPLFSFFFFALVSFTLGLAASASLWRVMLWSHVQTSPRHSTPSHWW